MWGEDTLFEKMVQDFEAVERDPNRDVDEQEETMSGTKIPQDIIDDASEMFGKDSSVSFEEIVSRILDVPIHKDWFEKEYHGNEFDLKQELEAIISESKTNEQTEVEFCPRCGNDLVTDDTGLHCKECDWHPGDPEEVEEKQEESKTNEQDEEVKEDTKGFISADTVRALIDAWELIGTYDEDPMVRSMSDEKVEEFVHMLSVGLEDPDRNEEVDEQEVKEMALSGNKYVIRSQAYNRKTGKEIGKQRDEEIDVSTNFLFRNVKSLGDIETAYERFWNDLNPDSEEIVKVLSVQPVGESKTTESFDLRNIWEPDGNKEDPRERSRTQKTESKSTKPFDLRSIWESDKVDISGLQEEQEEKVNEQIGGEMIGPIDIEPEDFDIVADTLDRLGEIDPELAEAEGQSNVTIVVTDGKRFMGVDPQGYDYARYKTDVYDSAQAVMDAAGHEGEWERKRTAGA